MTIVELLILLLYGTFAIDLLGFPVPSEASTLQLFFPQQKSETLRNNLLSKVQQLPLLSKIGLLLLPTLVGIFTYLLPLFVVLLPNLTQFFGPFQPELQWPLTIAGLLLAYLGRGLSILSAIQIRKRNQNPTQKALKTQRLFQHSRNPILLGLHLTFIGLALIYPVWVVFFGGLVYFANMHFKVILEEHFLKEKFGTSFIQYCQKTNRYF
ncbi:MAG: methyltransferase [Bacteroidota bacterium]